MKTIGEYLISARKNKGISIHELSEKTKIRTGFLKALEREKWSELPEFSVVTGFVKSVAGELDMPREQVVALLRRDYPSTRSARSGQVLPRSEIKREFRVSPQLTFFFGVALVILVIAGYLVAQYISFVRPPELRVDSPTEGQIILTRELTVSGTTSVNTTVIVNTQPALVAQDGAFATTIEIDENTSKVEVVATSRAGKETRVTRTIKPELKNN